MSGALLQFGDVGPSSPVEDIADVVIIGTGVAGATAARVLTEAGVDVILIEEGPSIPTEELRGDLFSGLRAAWRDMGGQLAQGRAFFPVLQGRCVGGTTAINGAIIHRIPEPIRALWEMDYAAGELLTADAMERVYDVMDEELHVAPPPRELWGGNNELFAAAADKAGIGSNPIRRNVKDCEGLARCLQGCPTARRHSMDISYVPRAIANGARVYATCRAERFITSGARAVGVKGRFYHPRTGRSGPRLQARARRAVICAASAIQTPLLLAANGVGRTSGLVGQRFQAHPGTAAVGVFDEPVEMWFGATQGYESTHYWDERMKFETLALPPELAAVRVPGLGPELMRRMADFGQLAMWGLQVRARARGRVRKALGGRTLIRYDITDGDVRVAKTGLRRLIEMMFSVGAREVLPGVHGLPTSITGVDQLDRLERLPDDPRMFHWIASHLFGTAVMGRDPKTSVVSPELECHDMPGLFVTDSSVFPTNLGVNPQHTIGAVAWLAAERMADRITG